MTALRPFLHKHKLAAGEVQEGFGRQGGEGSGRGRGGGWELMLFVFVLGLVVGFLTGLVRGG